MQPAELSTFLTITNRMDTPGIYFLVILNLFLLMVIAFLFFKWRKLKQETHHLKQEIAARNDQIYRLNIENATIKLQINEKESEANRQLTALKQKNRIMTGMVVHDLKNPLYSILGMSSGQSAGSKLEYFHETAKRMLRLVLNILDLSKHEESPIQPVYSLFEVQDLLGEVIADLSPTLRDKSLQIRVSSEGNYRLKADRALIARLFENLLTNAILHSDPDKPVMVNLKKENDCLRTEIVNHGIAIPQELHSTLFDPFVHAATAKSPMSSTGLGLAFCKMVTEIHSGTIGFQSEVGQPVIFWFTLPDCTEGTETATTDMEFDFKPDFNWLSEIMQNHSELLAPLKTYEVFEMSRIMQVLQQFHPQPEDPASEWKKEIEQAVYHCDNVRFKELTKLVGPATEKH